MNYCFLFFVRETRDVLYYESRMAIYYCIPGFPRKVFTIKLSFNMKNFIKVLIIEWNIKLMLTRYDYDASQKSRSFEVRRFTDMTFTTASPLAKQKFNRKSALELFIALFRTWTDSSGMRRPSGESNAIENLWMQKFVWRNFLGSGMMKISFWYISGSRQLQKIWGPET